MPKSHSAETIWEFDSQEACSGATGIPVHIIKQAKENGCTGAFVYGRVRLGPLLKFIFEKREDGKEPLNWDKELKKWRAHQAKTKAQKDAKLVTENEFIDAAILKCGQSITAILRQRLENEQPAILEGLEKAQIRIKLKAVCDEIIKAFQDMEIHWRQHIESDERQAQ